MKILVVDDSPENLLLLDQHLNSLGYATVCARNGAEAVSVYQAQRPDLVIMDVEMPELDGYQATARIRHLDTERWVPILFLSAITNDSERTKGLEAGGDDYLAKPVNLFLLNNKILALRRIADMQDQVSHYARQLQSNLEQNRDERLLARYLLDHIIRQDKEEPDLVKAWVSPAQHFSGDVVMTARSPGNELNVLLADATGHGLSAAISVIPVIESFYSMTEKGFTLTSIVRELNRKVKQLLPVDRFVAAAFISIDYTNQTIRVWNGGAPEVFFVNDGGEIQRTWPSAHPALGILGDDDFDSTPQYFQWEALGDVFMCSDGLPEAEDSNTIPFSMTQFKKLLARPYGTGRFQLIKDTLIAHIEGAQQQDDISLVAVRCGEPPHWLQVVQSSAQPRQPSSQGHSRWCLKLSLGAEEIKQLDALPLIMNWLDQLQIGSHHRGQAFLVLGELFNNALDHGLLRLDSQAKQDPNGFERYINQREERLAALTEGSVEVGLERFHLDGQERLRITVRDSGPGFDFAGMIAKREAHQNQLSGRGIMLVKQLCLSLDYFGNGNEATAVYPLS
jgi:CheY-like chemotaxis protein